MSVELLIEPGLKRVDAAAPGATGVLDGVPLREWRSRARVDLGIDATRPVLGTGHQTLLWHPGILAKYLLVDAMVRHDERFATANLVVDQHTGAFGRFDVPVRPAGGPLAVASIALTEARPDVPMGVHPPFDPARPAGLDDAALPAVARGIERIVQAVARHRDEPNAAAQMAGALDELMSPWVEPMPRVLASDLLSTGLGVAVLERMGAEPRACAERYNEAVASVPDAGIGPLAIGADAVELPLWCLDAESRRVRATDRELRRWLRDREPAIMPRALLLTALVRLSMCDLFVHGTGGARYDRAMERWLRAWLDVVPAPIAVVTATVRLPLGDPAATVATVRRMWHDPEGDEGACPSEAKQALLELIAQAPRRSRERAAHFAELHEYLSEARERRARDIDEMRRRVEDAPVAARRDWAFPLYPPEMIDGLAEQVRAQAAPASGTRPRAQLESPEG